MGRAAGAGGMGVVGVLVVLAVGYFFGIDISPIVGALDEGGAPGESRELTQEEREIGQFVSVVLADTEEVWAGVLPDQAGMRYQDPGLVLFSGAVQSACGGASAAMGPFYCPGDRKVYLDTDFFRVMAGKMGAGGDFAYAYVIAHEVGHHVQTLLGISDQVQRAKARVSEREANRIQVMMELQADCLAGVWANLNHQLKNRLEEGDIDEALNAASQIGDDLRARRATVEMIFECGPFAVR